MTRRLLFAISLAAFTPTLAHAQNAEPQFSRHVAAVFSRLGCNGGTCHGAVKGQNGFRLSLFGADPALDHDRLLREFGGRRLNFQTPEQACCSEGDRRRSATAAASAWTPAAPSTNSCAAGSPAGASSTPPERSRVTELRVTPAEHTAKPGEELSAQVEATFADGTTEDVTRLCSFESLDSHVAAVERDGAGADQGRRRHGPDRPLPRRAGRRPRARAPRRQARRFPT